MGLTGKLIQQSHKQDDLAEESRDCSGITLKRKQPEESLRASRAQADTLFYRDYWCLKGADLAANTAVRIVSDKAFIIQLHI